MRTSLTLAVACFVAALSAAATANEIPTPITSSQFAAAEEGEVLIETERGDVNRGQVIGLVRAPIADVVAIIQDTENHDQWFPDTITSSQLESEGSTSLTSGVTRVPLLRNRTWHLTGTHSRPTYSGITCDLMEYAYVPGSGNMNDVFGYWLVCPRGSNTVVKYVINADLGMWLPGAIVNWAQRRMLPGIIEGLQSRWESQRGG